MYKNAKEKEANILYGCIMDINHFPSDIEETNKTRENKKEEKRENKDINLSKLSNSPFVVIGRKINKAERL